MREKPWQFRKTEKRKLEKALEALREIIKRGYDCIPEARHAEYAIHQVFKMEGRIRERFWMDGVI